MKKIDLIYSNFPNLCFVVTQLPRVRSIFLYNLFLYLVLVYTQMNRLVCSLIILLVALNFVVAELTQTEIELECYKLAKNLTTAIKFDPTPGAKKVERTRVEKELLSDREAADLCIGANTVNGPVECYKYLELFFIKPKHAARICHGASNNEPANCWNNNAIAEGKKTGKFSASASFLNKIITQCSAFSDKNFLRRLERDTTFSHIPGLDLTPRLFKEAKKDEL